MGCELGNNSQMPANRESMPSQLPKIALFARFAAVAKAMAHAHRLELLEQLAQGERCVEVLAQRVGLTIANASQHLQQMRGAGMLAARRDGKFVYYRLADVAVLDAMAALRQIAERNVAEVERLALGYFSGRDGQRPASRRDLTEMMRVGTAVALDVRPADEFALGHVAGAVNIPLRELEARLGELNSALRIVVYCRGPYCMLAYEAVALLRARGFCVRRLEDGLPEWRAAGLPVVTGA
jgi:rhodanese-related sulfurtransferase/DNA-binding transcriptional ArsR family regulator